MNYTTSVFKYVMDTFETFQNQFRTPTCQSEEERYQYNDRTLSIELYLKNKKKLEG